MRSELQERERDCPSARRLSLATTRLLTAGTTVGGRRVGDAQRAKCNNNNNNNVRLVLPLENPLRRLEQRRALRVANARQIASNSRQPARNRTGLRAGWVLRVFRRRTRARCGHIRTQVAQTSPNGPKAMSKLLPYLGHLLGVHGLAVVLPRPRVWRVVADGIGRVRQRILLKRCNRIADTIRLQAPIGGIRRARARREHSARSAAELENGPPR